MPDDIDAITVKVAAARLGVSWRVVRRMLGRRELSGYRFGGSGLGFVRLDASEVDAKAFHAPSHRSNSTGDSGNPDGRKVHVPGFAATKLAGIATHRGQLQRFGPFHPISAG